MKAILLFLLSFCLSACVSISTSTSLKKFEDQIAIAQKPWLQSGLLMSERIEKKFGSFGVEVLSQDEHKGIRLANLYSKEDKNKVTRVIALTKYENPIGKKLMQAHTEILAGGSIGATLAKNGFSIKKQVFFKGKLDHIPVRLDSLMGSKNSSYTTVMYELIAQKGKDSLPYCSITEVYSPQFLTMPELDLIYSDSGLHKIQGNVRESFTANTSSATKIQENISFLKEALLIK